MGREWDTFRMDERSARWSSRSGEAGGFGETGDGSLLPNYGRRRTTSRCRTCGKRDAFRNPHACDQADGGADWVTEYVDDVPVEMRAFQNWSYAWAVEAYRLLKPGGHLLAFGGTRTYHRMAVAVEDAGFDVRDSLHWIYGSGFPKSLDVSKQIDKIAGAEREVVGDKPWKSNNGRNKVYGKFNAESEVLPVTAPATADAERWAGWGTALKPAHEPIVLARKPLAESTVTANVLRHGVGALNIGAARVGDGGGTTGGPRNENWRPAGTNDRPSVVDIEAIDAGRWPANVLLSHLATCEGSGPNHTDVLCTPNHDLLAAECELPDGTRLDVLAADEEVVLAALSLVLRDLRDGSRTEDSRSARANEPEHARHGSSLTDSLGGCPACLRSGDALARLAAGDDPANARLLADALALFLDLEPSPAHSRRARPSDPSSSDAAPPTSPSPCTPPSRTETAASDDEPETASHKTRKARPSPSSAAPPDSTQESSSVGDGSVSNGRYDHTSCTEQLCRPLAAEALSLAARYLPLILVWRWHRTGCPVAEMNEASGESVTPASVTRGAKRSGQSGLGELGRQDDVPCYGDEGGAARFFYVSKPRTRERVGGTIRNLHPTVKPIDLMRYLVRMVTPPGGLVLDPFLGSGTTGCAAMLEGLGFVGMERDPDSFDTALARVSDYAFAAGRDRPVTERPE